MDNNMNNTVTAETLTTTNYGAEMGNGKMRERFTRLWVWFGWVGFIVAMVKGNREEEVTKNHINHALGMNIIMSAVGLFSCLFCIPYLGWVLAVIFCLPILAIEVYTVVVTVNGIIRSGQNREMDFFLYNKFHIIK
ncbi:MAG: hypothetical protein IJ040_07505 [Lachnospiraceae bacterium]|nr:hypothetical protein [Lachnospiraceae bacterium]